MDESVRWAIVCLHVLLTVIGVGLIFYLCYRVARRLLALLFWCAQTGSNEPATTIITLAISIWFFPQPITYVIAAIPEFLKIVLRSIPGLVMSPLTSVLETCSNKFQCIEVFAGLWITGLSKTLADGIYALRLPQFPFIETIFLAALWIALSRISDNARSPAMKSEDFSDRFHSVKHLLANMSSGSKQNLLLCVLLALAAYLSMASIVAIPSLQAGSKAPDDVTVESLRERLSQSVLSEAQYEQRYPAAIIQSDPLASAKTLLKSKGPQLEGRIIGQIIADQSNKRDEIINAWDQLRKATFERQREVMDTTVNVYRVGSLDRKGVREQVQHFLEIDDWFRATLGAQRSRLHACRQAIASVDAALLLMAPLMVDEKRDLNISTFFTEKLSDDLPPI